MSETQMREYLKNAYSGPDWEQKVAKMSANQVFAMYNRLNNPKK